MEFDIFEQLGHGEKSLEYSKSKTANNINGCFRHKFYDMLKACLPHAFPSSIFAWYIVFIFKNKVVSRRMKL